MTEIFVSYKREDRERVRPLVEALRVEGIKVWWDQDIEPGAPWEARIQEVLHQARCVIVVWSTLSSHPEHGAAVQVEAREANRAGKLLQVAIDPVSPPLFFRQWQAADLHEWKGEIDHGAFQMVLRAARDVIGGAQKADYFHVAAPAADRKRAPRSRRTRLAIIAAGALAACAALAATIATSGEFLSAYACTALNPRKLCVSDAEIDSFELRLSEAKSRLAQRAVVLVNDKEQNWPTLGWSITQLAASNAEALKGVRAEYAARVEGLLVEGCLCLHYGATPHTVSNAWLLIADSSFAAAAPRSVIEAMLTAQSQEGWWSSALDAKDDEANAAIYATAFVVLALQQQIDVGDLDQEIERAMRAAIDRAALWLSHEIATTDGFLRDYPHSSRNMRNPGIDGQTLAALTIARPALDFSKQAERLVTALDPLPPLWETASSDAQVRRRTGEQYYDDFRHVAAPWIMLGAVSGMRDLGPADRARVIVALRRVFRRDMTSSELFARDWVAAEAIYALDETTRRLRRMSAQL